MAQPDVVIPDGWEDAGPVPDAAVAIPEGWEDAGPVPDQQPVAPDAITNEELALRTRGPTVPLGNGQSVLRSTLTTEAAPESGPAFGSDGTRMLPSLMAANAGTVDPDVVDETAVRNAKLRRAFELAKSKDGPALGRAVEISRTFNVPVRQVLPNLPEFERAAEAAKFDPDAFYRDNKLLADVMVDSPETMAAVVVDPNVGPLVQAFRKVQDLGLPSALSTAFNLGPGFAMQAPAMLGKKAMRLWQMANGVDVEAADKQAAADEADATSKQRNAKQTKFDSPEAKAIREAGDVERTALTLQRRYREARAQADMATAASDLAMAEAKDELGMGDGGQAAAEAGRRVQDARAASRPLLLGEGDALAFVGDNLQALVSTFDTLVGSAKGMGAGAVAGAVAGGVAGAVGTKTPAGAAAGAKEGAKLGAEKGRTIGGVLSAFRAEQGGKYLDLRDAVTDDGQRLTKLEALGGSVSYGLVAAYLENLGTQAQFAPAADALKGQVRKLLLGDPLFRSKVAGLARAWVNGAGTEAVTEGLQSTADQVIEYAAKSLKDERLQRGPAFNPEQSLQEAQGGLFGGGVITGATSLSTVALEAISTDTAAVTSPRQVAVIATLAEQQPVRGAPAEFAEVVRRATAEAGAPVREFWVEASALQRLNQEAGKNDEQLAMELGEAAGPEAVQAYQAAVAEGGRFPVPLEQVLTTWAASPLGQSLLEHTATSETAPTAAQLTGDATALEAIRGHALQMAQKAMEESADEDGFDDALDTMRRDIMDAGRSGKEARDAVQVVRAFYATAKADNPSLTWKKVLETAGLLEFAEGDDGDTKVRVKAIDAATDLRNLLDFGGPNETPLTIEQKAELLFRDDVSGLRTAEGWDLAKKPEGFMVAQVTTPDAKAVNDNPAGSHDATNALLARMGAVVAKHDATAARAGTNFWLHVKDQAALDALMADLRAAMPAGMTAYGAVASTREQAGRNLDKVVDEARTSGVVPPRGQTAYTGPLNNLAEGVQLPTTPLGNEHLGAVDAEGKYEGREKFGTRAFLDDVVPGLLSRLGFLKSKPAKFTASMDLRGIRDTNIELGKRAGDALILAFGDRLAMLGGQAFAAAHLSGDEYAMKSDSKEALVEMLSDLRDELAGMPVELEAETLTASSKKALVALAEVLGTKTVGALVINGNEFTFTGKAAYLSLLDVLTEGSAVDAVVRIGAQSLPGLKFRFGLAEGTYGAADKDLNARKRDELAGIGAEASDGGGVLEGRPARDDLRERGSSVEERRARAQYRGTPAPRPFVDAAEGETAEDGGGDFAGGEGDGRTAVRVALADPEAIESLRSAIGRMKTLVPEQQARVARYKAFLAYVEGSAPRPKSAAGEAAGLKRTEQLDMLKRFGIDDPEGTFVEQRQLGGIDAGLRRAKKKKTGTANPNQADETRLKLLRGEKLFYQGAADEGVAAIPAGQPVPGRPDTTDFTALLTPEQRAQGLRVEVQRMPSRQETELEDGSVKFGPPVEMLVASLLSKENPVVGEGSVNGFVAPGADGTVELNVGDAELSAGYQNQRLGLALYEALYRQALDAGAVRVVGGAHSAAASRVHKSITRKHGLTGYAPTTMEDGKLQPYSYSLQPERLYQSDVTTPAVSPVKLSDGRSIIFDTQVSPGVVLGPAYGRAPETMVAVLDLEKLEATIADLRKEWATDSTAVKWLDPIMSSVRSGQLDAAKRELGAALMAEREFQDLRDAATPLEAEVWREAEHLGANTWVHNGRLRGRNQVWAYMPEGTTKAQAVASAFGESNLTEEGLDEYDFGTVDPIEFAADRDMPLESWSKLAPFYRALEERTTMTAARTNGEKTASKFKRGNLGLKPADQQTLEVAIDQFESETGRLYQSDPLSRALSDGRRVVVENFDAPVAGKMVMESRVSLVNLPAIKATLKKVREVFATVPQGAPTDDQQTVRFYAELRDKMVSGLEDAIAAVEAGDSEEATKRIGDAFMAEGEWLPAESLLNSSIVGDAVDALGTSFTMTEARKENPFNLSESDQQEVLVALDEYEAATGRMQQDEANMRSSPRGYFERPPPGAEGVARVMRVFLNKKADASTVFHESAHGFLEMLGNLAEAEGAGARTKQQWADTLKWLGVSSRAEVKRDQHEKFARAFEAFLREGRAPSEGLRGTFNRAKAWLMRIYKQVAQLDVELDDDIRRIFSRLLATDDEIARANGKRGASPWETAEEAGMSPEAFQEYLDANREALAFATRQAQMRFTREALEDAERDFAEQLTAARVDAEAEYEALPARKAARYLDGQAKDLLDAGLTMAPVVLDRSAVESAVGATGVRKFRTRRQGGARPDDVATLVGYPTGKDMLQAIASLPPAAKWVEQRAQALAEERDAAGAAELARLRKDVESGVQAYVEARLAREWTELGRRAEPGSDVSELGRQVALEMLRQASRLIVERQRVGTLSPAKVLGRERAAAVKVRNAARTGNMDAARDWFREQTLQAYTHGATLDAIKERDRFEKMASGLTETAARARLGKASPSLRDAVDYLLGVFGLGAETELTGETLQAAAAVLEESGGVPGDWLEALQVPELQGSGDWRNLSVANLRHLDAALRQLLAEARFRNEVMVGERMADIEATEAAALAEIESTLPALRAPGSSTSDSTVDVAMSFLSASDGYLTNPVDLIRDLTGDNIDSTLFKAIIDPMRRARDKKVDLLKKSVQPITDAIEAMPEELKNRLSDAVDGNRLFPNHIEELQPPRMVHELLVLALNVGNPGNLQRLTDGRRITVEEVARAIDTLPDSALRYVQTVWDANESLKGEAFDLEERVTGIRPQGVERRPFRLPSGRVLEGGYVPAVYDVRASLLGQKQQDEKLAAAFDPHFVRAGTSHNHLKSRSKEVTEHAISLDMHVVYRHLSQVAHDIAFRETIMSVGRLVLRPAMQKAFNKYLGDKKTRGLWRWLTDVGSNTGADVTVADKLMSFARSEGSRILLGWKPSTAFGDLANPFAAVASTPLKMKFLAMGIRDFGRAPFAAREAALAASPWLRTMVDNTKQQFDLQVKKILKKDLPAPLRWYRDHAFWFMETMAVATTTPTWMGAVKQALAEGRTKEEAVRFADDVLSQAWPSHSPVDQAAILRDKGVGGRLTVFYGYLSVAYRAQRRIIRPLFEREFLDATIGPQVKTVAGVSVRLLGFLTAYAALGELLMGRGPEEGDEDEEEPNNPLLRWRNWYLRKLATAPVQALPFVDWARAIDAAVLGKRAPSARGSPVATLTELITKDIGTALNGDKPALDRVLAILKLALEAKGLSPGPVSTQGKYLLDVTLGDLPVEDPLDVTSGLMYGQRKGQPANVFRPLVQ